MVSKERVISLLKGERCQVCKNAKPDVRIRLNPYDFEIHNLTREQLLCDDCYDDLQRDI